MAQIIYRKANRNVKMISRTDHNVKHVTAFRFSPDLARKNIPQRVSPRDDKYYFPKIATSPLWDIIPETLRVYAFLNLSARQWRTLTWRQVRLCKIHGVYRYLYTRELRVLQQVFPRPLRQRRRTTTMTSGRESCRSISHSFYQRRV